MPSSTLIRRATSACIDAASVPARSRPVQNAAPLARTRSTRAPLRGPASASAASIASNIPPVISLPASGLFSVKVSTPAVESIFRRWEASSFCIMKSPWKQKGFSGYTVYSPP